MNSAPTTAALVLHHDGATGQCGTFTPEDDGPLVVIVGAERIARLARRHGLDAQMLIAFALQGAPS